MEENSRKTAKNNGKRATKKNKEKIVEIQKTYLLKKWLEMGKEWRIIKKGLIVEEKTARNEGKSARKKK